MLIHIDPFFRRFFIVTAMCLFLYLIYGMSSVIIPFVVAFILAYLFNPIVTWLQKIMPRWAAIITLYTFIIMIMFIIMSILVPMLWQQSQKVWNYVPVSVDWYNNKFSPLIQTYIDVTLPHIGNDSSDSSSFVSYIKQNYNIEDAQGLFSTILYSGLKVINNAGLILLIPILMFYFLLSWHNRLNLLLVSLPHKHKPTIVEIVHECDKALMAFIRGQLLVMFLLGVIYAVQLHLIGLDLGLMIGMIAGLASFVPYLGFGIGLIAAMVAGIFQFGLNWMSLGLIGCAFMVGQMIEGYILQPFLLGDKIGLSPLWVMFSVLAGAALMGFVGMLIALPVSAVINVLFKHAYEIYLKSDFYTEEGYSE